jgi:hypothetical protein
MVNLIQELWDQVWQHSTTLIYIFLGDRLTGSIDENRRLLAGVKAKHLPMISGIFDKRIRLTLKAWRRSRCGYARRSTGFFPTCCSCVARHDARHRMINTPGYARHQQNRGHRRRHGRRSYTRHK